MANMPIASKILYIMVENARMGTDSEMSRHAIQNEFAHGDNYIPFTSIKIKSAQTGTISASPYIGIGPEGLVHGINVGLDIAVPEGGSIGVGVGTGTNGSSQGLRVAHKSGVGAYISSVGIGTSTEQTTAGLSINREDWSLRFENDVFAFQGEDRWRTGGAEVTIGDFVFGSQVFTNDPKGMGDDVDLNGTSKIWGSHRYREDRFGAWKNGTTSRSPFYVGYKNGNSIHRVGINNPIVQDITQNGIHVLSKATRQNFYNRYTNYNGVYYQTGTYNPFSIYYY